MAHRAYDSPTPEDSIEVIRARTHAVSITNVIGYYALILGIFLLYSVGFIAYKIDEDIAEVEKFYYTMTATGGHGTGHGEPHHVRPVAKRDQNSNETEHEDNTTDMSSLSTEMDVSRTKSLAARTKAPTNATHRFSTMENITRCTHEPLQTFPDLFDG